MKIQFNKKDILKTLSKIQSLNTKMTQDILIEARGSKMFIKATDLDTFFILSLDALVSSEGFVVFNSKIFYNIIKNCQEDTIAITDNEVLGLIVDPTGDYPNRFPRLPNNGQQVGLKDMKIIKPDKFESRTFLLGNLFTEGKVISTDSKRLHCSKVDYVGEDILLDKRGLTFLKKFGSSFLMTVTSRHAIFSKDNITVFVKLLECSPPPLDKLLSVSRHTPVDLDIKLLITKVKMLSILSETIFLNFGESLTLTAGGTSTTIETSRTEPRELRFNSKYLLEGLSSFKDATLYINDSLCVIKDAHNTFVLMARTA